MIRPKFFGSNPETMISNSFQSEHLEKDSEEVSQSALDEFDVFVNSLRAWEVDVEVFDQPADNTSPDIVFPNNWFSIHPEGYLIFYPLESKVRRTERLEKVKDFLIAFYEGYEVVDMSWFEEENQFLEGTGSMVFDRKNKRIFCGLSSRSSSDLLRRVGEILKYEIIPFETRDHLGSPIYHTNVLMSVGSDLAIFCPDCVKVKKKSKEILEMLSEGRKSVISIDEQQMGSFCGNVLEIKNHKEKRGVLMSSRAMRSFSEEQIHEIEHHRIIIHSDLDTIEKYGGGSARCMVSELF